MDKRYSAWLSSMLSEAARKRIEFVIVYIAIGGFLLHLSLIAMVHSNVITGLNKNYLLNNPIAAIYTPFSFILVYEVYLLIYYLPKSTTVYIAKQYEIVTLIVIRRVFKDLSQLEYTRDWFLVKYDIQFSLDLAATPLLFFLIFIFYRLSHIQEGSKCRSIAVSPEVLKFIVIKKIVAALLIPLLLILSLYSFGTWITHSFFSISLLLQNMNAVNNIFFDDFFTVLILVDVLLLLFSFLYTDKFHKIIRNSGFIISTTLIKLSFAAEGILNISLILIAVLFGVFILAIHNRYEKADFGKTTMEGPPVIKV
jgi:hypothetical protein